MKPKPIIECSFEAMNKALLKYSDSAKAEIEGLVEQYLHADAIESQDEINCEIDIFDSMTAQGFKLNMITGDYYDGSL